MHFAGRWDGKHRKRINGVVEHCYFGIRLKVANTNEFGIGESGDFLDSSLTQKSSSF